MLENDEIYRVCEEIKTLIDPQKIFLYSTKLNAKGEKIKGFDLCVVTNKDNRLDSEKKIYSQIEASMPFNVIVYNNEEWQQLLLVSDSFANFINKKGKIIYEKR